jgi:membrane-associated phospholipid phosphatase
MGTEVRRVVAEVGKEIRGEPRPGVDHNAGSNPWAAMPSDHFASALMTATVLCGVDRRLGAMAAAYALALGAVLVYAGEHYITDLAAGASLAAAVAAAAPHLEPLATRLAAGINRLAPAPA